VEGWAAVSEIWNSVAPGWEANAGFVDEQLALATETLLDTTRVGEGDRVLDLAAGHGGAGLAAAEMVAVAAKRASADARVSTAVFGQSEIDFGDASFDAVINRHGLMFVAVGAQFGVPFPPPNVPGQFALDTPDVLTSVLRDGGLEDVAVKAMSTPMRAASRGGIVGARAQARGAARDCTGRDGSRGPRRDRRARDPVRHQGGCRRRWRNRVRGLGADWLGPQSPRSKRRSAATEGVSCSP
jgi:hypothetical protein